jgi:phosphoglucosamine mutase
LRIKERRPLDILCKEIPLIQEVEKKLDGQGRLLIRYSGTEPLLRLLIEGRDERVINATADELIEQLSVVLGL